MLVILSLLNIYHIYSEYAKDVKKEKRYYKGYFQVYDDVSGDFDTEKIEYVISEYEKAKAIVDTRKYSTEPNQPDTHTGYIFGDYGLFSKIKNEMDRLYHYDKAMEQLTQKAADNVRFYQEKGNHYQTKVNQKIINAYQGRKVSAFYDTFGLEMYFKYDFSKLLILILLMPMLSPLFAREHEIEMYGLLRITQNFRKMALGKIIAGALSVCIITVIFLAEDFAAFSYLYHIKGLSQPIYTLSDFYYSPLNISIGSYILLNCLLKMIGFLAIGGVCTAASAITRNEIIPFCVSFVSALILVVADAFSENKLLYLLNPVTLFSSGKLLKEFNVTPVAGEPVYTVFLPIIAAVAEFIVLCAITVITQKHKRRGRNEV